MLTDSFNKKDAYQGLGILLRMGSLKVCMNMGYLLDMYAHTIHRHPSCYLGLTPTSQFRDNLYHQL